MTILEVIHRSAAFLAKKGVDSPRLQIESLLARVLRVPRLNLYLNFERELTAAELESVRELVKRRGDREPLQHILGSTSFCGMEIRVNRNVLVPRPETELLAERAWRFLTGLGTKPAVALDFGTGSGCIAIVLAMKCPSVRVHAVDISQAAINVAKENAALHAVTDRIQFHPGDGYGALPADSAFDLIVANPPYIPGAEIGALSPEVRDHEPRLALDGGADGLDFCRRLAAESAPFLCPAGRLMLELGDGQAEPASAIFVRHKWVVEAIEADYSGRQRIFVARRNGCEPAAPAV